MSSLSKIFDALNVVLYSADMREVIKPVRMSGVVIPSNYLVYLNKGHFYNGIDKIRMDEGSFYFRPAGSLVNLTIGNADTYLTFEKEEGFPSEEQRNEFQKLLNPFEDLSDKKEVFSAIIFEVLLHNTFPLFQILQLPRIPLPHNDELAFLIRELCIEYYQDKLGKQRILKNFTEEIVIHILRYISSLPAFEKNLEKVNFLGDKRLIEIIEYVRSNINGDLTNKKIAQVCFLSEDYIGQFFKNLTNERLQDFVEDQRLQMAMHKLNTTSDSVQEIAYAVGFKDPAYFSRRFKIKYNVNANSSRIKKNILL